MLLGAAPHSKYHSELNLSLLLELRAEQCGCQATRPLSKALPGFGHLKPSEQLNFPWTGWSSSCPSAVLQAHFHIVQTKLTLIFLWKLLCIVSLSSWVWNLSKSYTWQDIAASSPPKLMNCASCTPVFGISYRNMSLWACLCQHSPLCFSRAAEQTHSAGLTSPEKARTDHVPSCAAECPGLEMVIRESQNGLSWKGSYR